MKRVELRSGTDDSDLSDATGDFDLAVTGSVAVGGDALAVECDLSDAFFQREGISLP